MWPAGLVQSSVRKRKTKQNPTPFAYLPSKPGRGDCGPEPPPALPILARTSEASVPRALPAAPGAANLHFPGAGLSTGQRNQPSQAGTRPAEPAGPQRPLDPRQRGWAWAPTATAPRTRAPEESEPHPRRRLRTYLQGRVGLLDSGHGPEGRRRGGPSPSPGPLGSLGVRDGAGRGHRPGDCGRPARPDAGSRGPGSPLSTRPSLPPPFCLPLRVAAAAAAVGRGFPGCGHFPASLARGPKTGGSRPPRWVPERASGWPRGLRAGRSPDVPELG